METILWHDYETFGANPTLDRPSQFAAIRTNHALEIVEDPVMFYCKPSLDVLPSIDACLVTGITPQEATEKGLSEPEFIKRVHAEFIRPGTCGAGYNSIRFDDEVTRHTLYRNFYDPYAREWQNGNSRWDIIDLVRATFALRPEGIRWPETEEGVPSFRLELLTDANNLDHGAAHDALSDVYATIAMARLIKDRQPKLYHYFWSRRTKNEVAKLLDLNTKKPVLHVSSKIPASRACTSVVMPFLQHPVNSNGVICIDLTVDPETWVDLSVEEWHQRLYKKAEDMAESETRLPLKTVHLNRAPVIAPISLLEGVSNPRVSIDIDACEAHWLGLLGRHDLRDKLKALFEMPYESDGQKKDVDASLYEGFISRNDRDICNQLINSDLSGMARHNFSFSDSRLNELFFRYKARHAPEALSGEERAIWHEEIKTKYFTADDNNKSLFDEYQSDLSARQSGECSVRDQHIFEKLEQWTIDFQKRFF